MQKIINLLSGKKTYIVGVVIVIVNALQTAQLISLESNQIEAINYVLGALALTSLRIGISKIEAKNS